MAELTAGLKKVLKDCGLTQAACWKHKQSGKWVIYHWACEVIATKKEITFDPPIMIDTNAVAKIAVICVTGRLGDRSEWSFGEAAPYNTTQSYPFAMAEKRAKDRVILKLVEVHGEAYSEEEADDFKGGPPRDIAHGVGSLKADPNATTYELINPWGEIDQELSSAKDYLDALVMRIESTGAWWPPNEHVVSDMGTRAKKAGDEVLRKHAHSVYKLGRDAWKQAPENAVNKEPS